MSSLQEYLNKHYISSSNTGGEKKKKRKRGTGEKDKEKERGSGLVIVDDDGDDILTSGKSTKIHTNKISRGPDLIVRQASNNTSDKLSIKSKNKSSNVASKFIQNDIPEDEKPIVVEENKSNKEGGLRSAYQVRMEFERKQKEEMDHLASLPIHESGQNAETIYRDESGQKVDINAVKAIERKKRLELIENEQKRMEWGKGLVQRAKIEREQAELAKEKHKPLARYKDDLEMNEQLKRRERWNDPAFHFLTKKDDNDSNNGLEFGSGLSSRKRFRYRGPPPPPNRFAIPPGYRWDGVDRSNGFEKDYFLRKNETSSRKDHYQMGEMDDM